MTEGRKILLACDLNRTVLPDGMETLSEGAFRKFGEFASKKNVVLAYVSGMNIDKSRKLVEKYQAPLPDYFVCDVGTTMYRKNNLNYEFYQKWWDRISSEWPGVDNIEVKGLLEDIKELKLQPEEDQGKYKISYYIKEDADTDELISVINERLGTRKMKTIIITSFNHVQHIGYLDILPPFATKAGATWFIASERKISDKDVYFAGDSGNDLDVLTSGCNGIVVKNARDGFKKEVQNAARAKGILERIYFAQGGFSGMNGNYVAGILEGMNYFGIL